MEKKKLMQYINYYNSPLGKIMLGSDGTALTGLWIEGEKYLPHKLSQAAEKKDLPIFNDTMHWLDIYFSGEIPKFTPELKEYGSKFRLDVWKILKEIPYGKVITYGKIATRIANQRGISKMSAQAVGGAVGHNSISIIIPCHRVIGTNGNLTGYSGGIKTKLKLLELEGVNTSKFYIPAKSTAP